MRVCVPRPRPRFAVLIAASIATTLLGCGNNLPALTSSDIGSIAVFVADQNGAGVPKASVYVAVPGPGSDVDDVEPTLSAGSIGNVTFTEIPVGDRPVWVIPPDGYTGGGAANAVTVHVVLDSTVTLRLTLTKTP
ncbi:MAG TPA: hypothetical protein VMH39_05435 [Gemmatimonadaceae bacterium]|nr:hypothetical protein [Gemmatimonadaceae bacterium]